MKTYPETLRSPGETIPEPKTSPGEMQTESVSLYSLGDELAGSLFLPGSSRPAPALIVCHGAGEFKENYFEMCEHLARRGVACLALDLHGHGASGGERYHVNMLEWVADIRAAIGYLSAHPRIDAGRVGAFGLSSGGTAILEAAVSEPRLKALVALDATVRNSLPASEALPLKILLAIGKLKRALTGKTLRLPLAKMSKLPKMTSDPEINRRVSTDPRGLAAFMAFPLPGAEQAFFVDTIQRVPQIAAPTLVIWGDEDAVDPVETARLLFAALSCKKRLEIIAGHGHLGHMDRHRTRVFELTADWLLENLTGA